MRLFLSFMLFLSTVSLTAQETIAIATDDWQHTSGDGSGALLEGTDTIYTDTDIFQVGEIQLELTNLKKGQPAQKMIMEVIYDDFVKERITLKLPKGKKKSKFSKTLKHNKIRNVAVVRLYGEEEPVNVELGDVSLTKTGKLENLNDANKDAVQYRPGPFEKYGVIRATYPMAKPPFFMNVNSHHITIKAYALPDKPGAEATATLEVTCIDSDKAWREEFEFELTEEPGTYSLELKEDLETEYEGYFMIFMPSPGSKDIAIRMVEIK